MAWTEVNLSDLPTGDELVPADAFYVFELLSGTKYGKFDPSRIEIAARIAEGEHTGRVLYGSYPDPEKQSWSLGVMARTVKVLGGDPEAGEDPVTFLNRKAGSKFLCKVNHRTGQDEVTRQEIKIGSIKAYAEEQ